MHVTYVYGSHLFGTNSASSDTDLKTIFVPKLEDLLLCKPLDIKKRRCHADGSPLDDSTPMTPGGWEEELVPLHRLVTDYIDGQTYAVELMFASPSKFEAGACSRPLVEFIQLIKDRYLTNNVDAMVGFALKQTFDYVERGKRLKKAEALDRLLDEIDPNLRLDAVWSGGHVIDALVSEEAGTFIGHVENNGKMLRSLELNNRSYLETSRVGHVKAAVQKLIKQYGERATKAAENDFDWKSLSHAVRVYEQSIELLNTGAMLLPRPNALDLLAIKQGSVDIEVVRTRLERLKDEVEAAKLATSLPPASEALRAAAAQDLLKFLLENTA